MSRVTRQILIAGLLALYGPASLCGVGMHALTDSGPAHHDHAGGHCDEGSSRSISAVHDRCPLCDVQTQGQLQVEVPQLVSRPHVRPHVVLVLPPVAARDRNTPGSPRAPPSSLANPI